MDTVAIERLSHSPISIPSQIVRRGHMEHDVEEIAVGFGRAFADRILIPEFGTTTRGSVTYRRVDPLRNTFQVADARLQSRLETLCDALRAKY